MLLRLVPYRQYKPLVTNLQYITVLIFFSRALQFCFRTYRQFFFFFFSVLTSDPMTQAFTLYLMTSEMHVLSLGLTDR